MKYAKHNRFLFFLIFLLSVIAVRPFIEDLRVAAVTSRVSYTLILLSIIGPMCVAVIVALMVGKFAAKGDTSN